MNATLAAGVAAVTSVVVTVLSLVMSNRQQMRREHHAQQQAINASYLNPLRVQLTECHFRLSGTLARLESPPGQATAMLSVEEPAEVSGKDAAWFNGPGCPLLTSVYLTACLFAQLKKVRDDIPYLRLSASDDTELTALLLRVQRGYIGEEGVYYVTQFSIGESIWVRDQARLMTYQEFCESLHDEGRRVWLDRLIRFHLEAARNERTDQVRRLVAAIQQFSAFLDRCVGGGHSIGSRWLAEDMEISGSPHP